MRKMSLFLTIVMIITMFTGCNLNTGILTPDVQTTQTPITDEIFDTSGGSNLEMYFIDVGQADCILSKLPNGQVMLIDGGNNEDGEYLVNLFKNMGISKIDYLIGTHPHEDHIGGLDNIVRDFDIGKVYMPNKYTDTKTFEYLIEAIENKQLKITKPVSGDYIYNTDDLKIRILAPISAEYSNLNDYSICIRMDYKDSSFLLTGDAEKKVEDEILAKNYDIDVDVFKAGHHGSTTSNSNKFLNKVTPEYTIISVGTENEYGHPHDEILATLQQRGSKVFRTDLNGTIKVTTDGKNIKVEAERGTNQTINITTPVQNTTPVTETKPIEQENPTTVTAPTDNHTVYVTPNGAKYHEEGCVHLGKNTRALSVEDAISEGYEPCKGCH